MIKLISNKDFKDGTIKGRQYYCCYFNEVEFTVAPAVAIGCEFTNCSFRACDFQLKIYTGSTFFDCDFRYANLKAADYRGCRWVRGQFDGAVLSWTSHDLMAALLHQADTEERWSAEIGQILLRRDWCWHTFADRAPAEGVEWARGVLTEWSGCPI